MRKPPKALMREIFDTLRLLGPFRTGHVRESGHDSIVITWRGREYELTIRPYYSDELIRHDLKRAAEWTHPRDALDLILSRIRSHG